MTKHTWNHRMVNTGSEIELAEVHYVDGKPWAYGSVQLLEDTDWDDLKVKDGFRKQIDWLLEAVDKPCIRYPEDFDGQHNED